MIHDDVSVEVRCCPEVIMSLPGVIVSGGILAAAGCAPVVLGRKGV